MKTKSERYYPESFAVDGVEGVSQVIIIIIIQNNCFKKQQILTKQIGGVHIYETDA